MPRLPSKTLQDLIRFFGKSILPPAVRIEERKPCIQNSFGGECIFVKSHQEILYSTKHEFLATIF